MPLIEPPFGPEQKILNKDILGLSNIINFVFHFSNIAIYYKFQRNVNNSFLIIV